MYSHFTKLSDRQHCIGALSVCISISKHRITKNFPHTYTAYLENQDRSSEKKVRIQKKKWRPNSWLNSKIIFRIKMLIIKIMIGLLTTFKLCKHKQKSRFMTFWMALTPKMFSGVWKSTQWSNYYICKKNYSAEKNLIIFEIKLLEILAVLIGYNIKISKT